MTDSAMSISASAREHAQVSIVIGLTAVIVTVDAEKALTLVVPEAGSAPPSLPSGPFDPASDRTFELALRTFVKDQTGFHLGYVEQLYTFGDLGRVAPSAPMASAAADTRVVAVGYLGLTADARETPSGRWADWYAFFPWEDLRAGRDNALDAVIAPKLRAWADSASGEGRRRACWQRARTLFGLDGAHWNEERVLDRYELLYEAGLVQEAALDTQSRTPEVSDGGPHVGRHLLSDHRRILATALQRLRGKIKYRPVIFQLMPETFTLSHLQTTVEAILGVSLHKQNFRRSLLASKLVDGTGDMLTATGGRPAELYRFRPSAAIGRPTLGIPAPRLKDV